MVQCTNKASTDPPTSVLFLSWQKPSYGYFKLNINGIHSLNGLIGTRGVICGHNGNWYHGFTKNIGTREVLQAEAWGLFSGLQLGISVETDSVVLVNLLHDSRLDLHPLGTLLLNCRHILSSFSSCCMTHIHREKNMVADCLAKRSIGHELSMCRFPYAPELLRQLYWMT